VVTSTVAKFGELTVEAHNGGFTLRGPKVAGDPAMLPCDPVTISHHVRADDAGKYRPLSGARTMRTGWATLCATRGDVDRLLDVIYPLARTHQDQWRAGNLRVVPIDDVLARQSGRYAHTSGLSAAGRQLVIETLCGGCVRTPVWAEKTLPEGGIPCPEACSLFVEQCRESAGLERNTLEVSAP